MNTSTIPSSEVLAAQTDAGHILEVYAPNVRVALPLLEDDDGYHLIPIANQDRPLSVFIEKEWEGYADNYADGRHMLFELFLQPPNLAPQLVLSSGYLLMPKPGNWTPVQGSIPLSYLQSGLYRMFYLVWLDDSGNAEKSHEFNIHVDKTPPNYGRQGRQIALVEPDKVIDADYLQRHGDQLKGYVQCWPDVRLGDMIEIYLESSLAEVEPFVPVTSVTVTADSKPLPQIDFAVKGDEVRSKGNGVRYLLYRLIDRSGNRGPLSPYLRVTVDVETELAKIFSAPQALDETLFGWIMCDTKPWRGIRLKVFSYSEKLLAGDQVELDWTLFRSTTGSDESNPVLPLVSEKFARHTLSPLEANRGYEVNMNDFKNWLLIPLLKQLDKEVEEGGGKRKAAECSAELSYIVYRKGAPIGSSLKHVIAISLQRPGGVICDGVNAT